MLLPAGGAAWSCSVEWKSSLYFKRGNGTARAVRELVDLLRPTVSSGNISSGVLAEEGGRSNSILALSDSPVVPYAILHKVSVSAF